MKKNIARYLGLTLLTLLLMVSCDLWEQKNPFTGTWETSEGYKVIFYDSSWHITQYAGGIELKGSYTYLDYTAHIVFTEISYFGISWRPITVSEAANYFTTATVSGNTLTWGLLTYTKK